MRVRMIAAAQSPDLPGRPRYSRHGPTRRRMRTPCTHIRLTVNQLETRGVRVHYVRAGPPWQLPSMSVSRNQSAASIRGSDDLSVG